MPQHLGIRFQAILPTTSATQIDLFTTIRAASSTFAMAAMAEPNTSDLVTIIQSLAATVEPLKLSVAEL
jgi:hypothetical protein